MNVTETFNTQPPYRVGIVSVSYKSEPEIREMIDSLGPDRAGVDLRIAIVSNSGDCEPLRAPCVDVIQSGGNVGFARACNLGAHHLDTEFLLFCNPDIRISPQIIRALAKLLADNPDYGIVAPFYGDVPQLCQPTGQLQQYPTRNLGACFIMRKSVFNQIHGFDEEFFLWWEDTDLRDRVLNTGLKVGFADGIVATHSGGHSYASVDLAKRKFLTRAWLSSHVHYRLKHKGLPTTLLWLVGMCSLNALRFFRPVVPGREYVLPSESLRFGLQLLAHAPSLRHYVSYNGQSYPWQSPS